MKIVYLLILILNTFNNGWAQSDPIEIRWKYLSIKKSLIPPATSRNHTNHLIDFIFRFDNYQITFKPVVDIHERLEEIPADSTLYGINLANNDITDKELNDLVKTNKIIFQRIQFIDLSNNRITSWNSKKFPEDVFTNLQVLVLDGNSQMSQMNFNLLNLRVLSLNKCNLGFIGDLETSNLRNLEYLGLGDNKITDISSSLNVYDLIDNLVPSNVRMLDLSSNKLTKFETIRYLLQEANIKQLGLEKNLLSQFDVNQLVMPIDSDRQIEINLRFNFIRNTSAEFYQLNGNSTGYGVVNQVALRLDGNPLVCDCSSMWILEEMRKLMIERQIKERERLAMFTYDYKSNNLPMLKRRKSYSVARKQHQMLTSSDPIRLIYKRETEKISSHYMLDDLNFEIYLQRQKRIRPGALEKGQVQASLSSVRILDLEDLKCSFIDVQSREINKSTQYSTNPSHFHPPLNSELQKQNFHVSQIQYREKPIIQSRYEDYMCQYEDHCIESDCNCCVFRHCHCRAICPRQCRCYFDTNLQQNIIDCSSLDLIEIPNEKSESATDMRLNSNSLKFLKAHAFFGFAKLKFLYLQNNQISYISSESFDDLQSSLAILNLEGNQLSYLNGDEFDKLNQLTVLILNGNPLKDIENVHFIDSSNLPSLKLVYLYNTEIVSNKNIEFIEYSKNFSNASILLEISTTITPESTTKIPSTSSPTTLTSTTMDTTTTSTRRLLISNSSLGYSPKSGTFQPVESVHKVMVVKNGAPVMSEQQENHTRLMTRFFSRFQLFNWYYFPALVFAVCLVLSFVIVLTVIIVVRRVETDSREVIMKGEKIVGVVDVDGGAFLASNYSSNLNPIQSDDEDDNSTKLMMVDRYCTCISRKLIRSFDSCEDFYESDHRNYDSSTVPVSRTVENLTLHVYIYYNLIDTDYVVNHLQPILKKCVTIVPDTKYFCKPQTDKYVKLSPESFYNLAQTNSSTLISSLNNTNSVLLLDSNSNSSDSSSSGLLKPTQVNSIIANILVISDNFYGYRPVTESYISLKYKNNSHKESTSSSVDASISSCYTDKKSFMINADNCFKKSFKVFINLEAVNTPSDENSIFNSTKTYSLNQRLMKRLYEPSGHKSFCSSDNKVSCQVKNDLLSSHAYNENLQKKMEKYLKYICLKSNKFSNNNFSYVDYTKR